MKGEKPRRVEKPWGFELVFAHTGKYAGKVLFIRQGCRLSLQYHQNKDESIYVQEGEVLVQLGANRRLSSASLRSGECLRIEPRTTHRLKAIKDTLLFEVSTPELDDIKRLEDDYGRA